MKSSFVLYTAYMAQMELLDMEQRGVLLTAIMSYSAGEELPEGFTCPLCKQPADKFEKVVE